VKLVYNENNIGTAVNNRKPMIHGEAKSHPAIASRTRIGETLLGRAIALIIIPRPTP
jgi:hypothetical protein